VHKEEEELFKVILTFKQDKAFTLLKEDKVISITDKHKITKITVLIFLLIIFLFQSLENATI
jgi:hypothetical protein